MSLLHIAQGLHRSSERSAVHIANHEKRKEQAFSGGSLPILVSLASVSASLQKNRHTRLLTLHQSVD